MLELIRRSKLPDSNFKIYHWRTYSGTKVDCIVELKNREIIPIEIKYTDTIKLKHAKGLLAFIKEYPNVKKSYIISTTPRPYKLTDNIEVIPWNG